MKLDRIGPLHVLDPVAPHQRHFLRLTDPRRGRTTRPLVNLVTIALCATIAGADDFVAMIAWARRHRDWPARFLDLSHGIPSHDCLNMLFRRLRPDEFERCLLSWLAALYATSGGTLVATDGRTLRRSFDKATARSAHLVGAWAVSQKLSLGVVAVDQKSNEITAVPELLKLIELSGAIVAIDAMGCQTAVESAEVYQLKPPDFRVDEVRTTVVLFAYYPLPRQRAFLESSRRRFPGTSSSWTIPPIRPNDTPNMYHIGPKFATSHVAIRPVPFRRKPVFKSLVSLKVVAEAGSYLDANRDYTESRP